MLVDDMARVRHLLQIAEKAENPASRLAALADAEHKLATARHELVAELVLAQDWTWSMVGEALGISRQGAAKVYGRTVDAVLRRRIRERTRNLG